MAFDWQKEVVTQFEFHWAQQLGARLRGLGDEEYLWEPVPGMWTIRRSGQTGEMVNDFTVPPPTPEPPTTIAWRLHHLIVVLEMTMVQVGGDEVAWDRTTAPAARADDALELLDSRVGEWRRRLGDLQQTQLEQPSRTALTRDAGLSVAGAVLHMHRELIHHGAEIALLRDLFRARSSSGHHDSLNATSAGD